MDGERLGIAGWSYGGYLARGDHPHHSLQGGLRGAGITNAASFNGTSDIPDFIPDYLGAEAWEDPQRTCATRPRSTPGPSAPLP